MTVARAFTQVKRSKPITGTIDEHPDWTNRAAHVIEPGQHYLMRNGHTAEIRVKKILTYGEGKSKRNFTIWYGRCVECNEPYGWNANGTYAAVGKHPLDLLRLL